MFDYDFGKLSMDALIQKQDQLHMRLNFAQYAGSSGLIESLLQMLDAVNFEVTQRLSLEAALIVVDKSPSIIETDPDLAALHKKEVEKEDGTAVTPEVRRKVAGRRSARPLRPEDLN